MLSAGICYTPRPIESADRIGARGRARGIARVHGENAIHDGPYVPAAPDADDTVRRGRTRRPLAASRDVCSPEQHAPADGGVRIGHRREGRRPERHLTCRMRRTRPQARQRRSRGVWRDPADLDAIGRAWDTPREERGITHREPLPRYAYGHDLKKATPPRTLWVPGNPIHFVPAAAVP